jgi:hypothetical protein
VRGLRSGVPSNLGPRLSVSLSDLYDRVVIFVLARPASLPSSMAINTFSTFGVQSLQTAGHSGCAPVGSCVPEEHAWKGSTRRIAVATVLTYNSLHQRRAEGKSNAQSFIVSIAMHAASMH